VKTGHPGLSSKDLISIMTRQWGEIGEEERRIWNYRAEQMKEQNVDHTIMAELSEMDDTNALELPTYDNGGGTKRAAAKKASAKSVSV
jgi:hypothetical protein